MPRVYVRKTDRVTNDPKVMIECAKKVLTEHKTAKSVAKEYGINCRTLSRFCSRADINELLNNAEKRIGYVCRYKKMSQVFTYDEERILIDCLLKSYTDVPCDLSSKNVRQFAYEFAKKTTKKVPRSWDNNKQAGKDWLLNFMKRHSDFSIIARREFLKLKNSANTGNNKSEENFFESVYMNLSFPIEDPLETFEETEKVKMDKVDNVQDDQFSNSETSNYGTEFISIKTEYDKVLMSEENVDTESSNFDDESTLYSLKISTIISECDSNQEEGSALNGQYSITLPSSWSVTELPVGEVYRYCLSFIITTIKDNIITPVIERCILLNIKNEIFFKARDKTLDNEKLQLPRMLEDLKKLPPILKKFQSLQTCKGLDNMEPNFFKEFSVIEDSLCTWRHRECSVLLLKNERCELCNQLFKTIQEKVGKFTDLNYFK